MACLKNILRISNFVLPRNTRTLPYSPIINSLHLGTSDNMLLYRKQGSSLQGLGRRSLFTPAALGIDSFETERNLIRQQYSEDTAESFRSKMQDLLDRSKRTHTLVYAENLQHTIYLTDNKEDHLNLVKEMAIKYCEQNSGHGFGTFQFGPIVLRLCCVLDRPDLAMEMVFSPELAKLFGTSSCYELLLSLLYQHKQYSEILDLMDQLSTGRLISQRYPRSCVMLALASAIQMDSEEGHIRGLALAEAALSLGNTQLRSAALAGTIALQAGRPDAAVQLLRNTKWPNYYTIKNILIVARCELKQLDQVVALLDPITEQDCGSLHDEPISIFKDTYDKVKAAVQQCVDPALTQQFARIERTLMDRRLITNQNLVDCVLQPLKMSKATSRYSRQEVAFYRGSVMR